MYKYICIYLYLFTGCTLKLMFYKYFEKIASLFHNSKSRKWFLMTRLRTKRYSHCQRWQPSPRARGSFAATALNFGGPQLPNGLPKRAYFWASRSVAPCHQYATSAIIQRVYRRRIWRQNHKLPVHSDIPTREMAAMRECAVLLVFGKIFYLPNLS
jgi:hypothetical protein